jgi:2Fe-2S ferredoxin
MSLLFYTNSVHFGLKRNSSEKITLNTYTNEYENLMELLNDNIFINNFGECKGIGKCCTCLIEIVSENFNILDVERNEHITLKKHNITNINKRLACQIMVDSNIHNLEISIVN